MFGFSLLLLGLVAGQSLQEDLQVKKIAKCCGKGEIISIKENFTCVEEKSTELHTSSKEVDWVHFNDCAVSGNISIVELDRSTDLEQIVGLSACVDLLHEENTIGFVPLVAYCRVEGDGRESATGSLEIPKFAKFGVCCPRGRKYDANLRDCISSGSGEDSADFLFDLLRQKSNIGLTNFVRGPPKCKHAIVDYVIDIETDLEVLHNGSIQITLRSEDDRRITVTDENSCLDLNGSGMPNDPITLRLCSHPEYCQRNACVRKCCPEGQARIGPGCQTTPDNTPPGEFHRELQIFVEEAVNRTTKWKPLNTASYALLAGEPACPYGKYSLAPDELPTIDSRGHVHANIQTPKYERYEHHQYCLELVRGIEGLEDGLYPIVCFTTEEPEPEPRTKFEINAALELTSCMFLLITFLVYVFLPLLQNLHGKTLMCHVASLFVAYGCLAAIALMPSPYLPDESSQADDSEIAQQRVICKFFGYTTLASFLAAFSWLNVMCFDIWWTFGGLGGAGMAGRRQGQRKRFFFYSLYAWGLAFTLVCCAIAADYTDIIGEHLRPNIGLDSCWFHQERNYFGELVFFIGPISIQLVVNVTFFILTSLHCSRVKAEISKVTRPSTDPKCRRFHSDKSKLIVNIKLFVVMGISWIMEITSFFMNNYADNLHWRAEFFYIADAFNCLQGLLIFILFVLKAKVYRALRHRLKTGGTHTPGNTMLQDPSRMRKSASCSTLMSTFAVNVNA